MKSIAVVIPSYNERDNIKRLIDSILQKINHAQIIVVDDESPDGTSDLVEQICKENQQVHLIRRKGKGGRGSACIAGFKMALEYGADLVLEMDADFSHNPEELPQMISAAEKADLVIGSRYLRDSRIVGWSLKRRMFSKFANIYARFMLHIPISDYTNGYRCYSADALKALELDRIFSKGYIVLSELSYQLFRKGFSFGEIPTLFVNRRRGISNVNYNEIREAFTSMARIRFYYKDIKKIKQS